MDNRKIYDVLKDIAGDEHVLCNASMINHTSMKVGGTADYIVMPASRDILVRLYRKCLELRVPVFVMGNGTNLIVRDGGIRGVVIKLTDNLCAYTVEETTIKADAGILLSRLSRIASEYGLSGLEFAEGIPGTLGGAVAMNAGAYTGVMSDIVTRSTYLKPDGSIMLLEGKDHNFGKRSSFVQADGGIILDTQLLLKHDSKDEIKARMDDFCAQRREKQPLELPSAGSVFKRPEGFFAGKLVEDCGLRGYRLGGAEVSCKHCGFIVNRENASAKDVTNLISHIRNKVLDKFGVELQTEVKIVGEDTF